MVVSIPTGCTYKDGRYTLTRPKRLAGLLLMCLSGARTTHTLPPELIVCIGLLVTPTLPEMIFARFHNGQYGRGHKKLDFRQGLDDGNTNLLVNNVNYLACIRRDVSMYDKFYPEIVFETAVLFMHAGNAFEKKIALAYIESLRRNSTVADVIHNENMCLSMGIKFAVNVDKRANATIAKILTNAATNDGVATNELVMGHAVKYITSTIYRTPGVDECKCKFTHTRDTTTHACEFTGTLDPNTLVRDVDDMVMLQLCKDLRRTTCTRHCDKRTSDHTGDALAVSNEC
jgi:hypothetical protein